MKVVRDTTRHVDCPGHAQDYVKNMITGAARDGWSDTGCISGGWSNATDKRAYIVGKAGRVPSMVVF